MDEGHRWRQEYLTRTWTGGTAWDALVGAFLRSDVPPPPHPRRWDDRQAGFPPMSDLTVRNVQACRESLRRHKG